MAKDIYVYSTLTCDNAYTDYVQGGAEIPIPQEPIVIKGGANLATTHLVTPYGVVTKITADQLDQLLGNRHFADHVKAGFITYSEHEKNPDVVAADMSSRAPDAPMVEGDFDMDSDEIESPKPVIKKVGRPAKK